MSSFSDRVHFSIAFPHGPSPLVDVWDLLSLYLRQKRLMPKIFKFSQMWGHRPEIQSEAALELNDREIASLIVERNLNGFMVHWGAGSKSIEFYLSQGKTGEMACKLGCMIGANAKSSDDWVELIESIASRFETIGSWQWRRRYCYWQGETHADDRYERRWGKMPPGVRVWTEPKAHALDSETLRVDISKNPGRHKDLSSEVSFIPTAEMWLGPHFWQYAKCTKEQALAAGFWLETRDTPHYTYFKCWPTAFTRPDGEQGRMQQRLWKLFFHEDCEWPPGSGSICDEPMYGPPELMPPALEKAQ